MEQKLTLGQNVKVHGRDYTFVGASRVRRVTYYTLEAVTPDGGEEDQLTVMADQFWNSVRLNHVTL